MKNQASLHPWWLFFKGQEFQKFLIHLKRVSNRGLLFGTGKYWQETEFVQPRSILYLFCFCVFLVHTEVSEMFQSSRNIAVKTCIMLSIICYCMGGESTVYVLGCVAALWKLAIFCVKCPVLGSQSSWQFLDAMPFWRLNVYPSLTQPHKVWWVPSILVSCTQKEGILGRSSLSLGFATGRN